MQRIMKSFELSPVLVELLTAEAPEGVTAVDVSRALSSRVRQAVDSLGFAKDPKVISKLSVDGSLSTARISEKSLAVIGEADRPWFAAIRLSNRIDAFLKEFPGTEFGSLPNTPEGQFLVVWTKSLRPRTATTPNTTAA